MLLYYKVDLSFIVEFCRLVTNSDDANWNIHIYNTQVTLLQ